MKAKYSEDKAMVFMSRGMYHVAYPDKVTENGSCYCGVTTVKETTDRFEAHQYQYMLNGWGMPEFTLGKTEGELVRNALDILNRHCFNRSYCISDFEKEWADKISKANAECFKNVLSRIGDASKKELLKKLWVAKYNFSNGKTAESEYKTNRTQWIDAIHAA